MRVPGAVVLLSALTLTLFACSDSSPEPDTAADASGSVADAEEDDADTGQGDADTGEDDADDDAGQGDADADAGQGDAGQEGQDTASLLIGRWLGPQPGFNEGECENGTTEYAFESDGTWLARNVNLDECGGTYTLGGTYTVSDDGGTLTLHFTQCPQGCSQFQDAPLSIDFVGDDSFTMSDPSFTGTYHRQ